MTREEAIRIVIPTDGGAVGGPKVRPIGVNDLEFFYDSGEIMPFRMRERKLPVKDWDWNWYFHEWELI